MHSDDQLRNLFSRAIPFAIMAAIAIILSTVLASASAQAQTYTEKVLYSFKGPPDAAGPYAGLVRDIQGNLYGTTYFGGVPCAFEYPGCGTVFKVDMSGKETVLHSFTGILGDGAGPLAPLTLGTQGNLYGTTISGGLYMNENGGGIVFDVALLTRSSSSSNESVLHTFIEGDGSVPQTGMVLDAHGNLYGATSYGGAFGAGVVFELDTSGKLTVLYSFTNGADGADPFGGRLIRDEQGNLYGTATFGGDFVCTGGCGVVFKVDTTGKETVLHTFTGPPDGARPIAGLVQDKQGNLYGTTDFGGANGFGTVFKLDTNGKETVLYSFFNEPDGAYPYEGLVEDGQGNLYGTTPVGGTSGCDNGCGVVFRVDSSGKYTILYSFTGGVDGAYPYTDLIFDKGNLYGTTSEGGAYGYGTVFELSPTF